MMMALNVWSQVVGLRRSLFQSKERPGERLNSSSLLRDVGLQKSITEQVLKQRQLQFDSIHSVYPYSDGLLRKI
jgi:hypothetical protein